MLKLCQYCQILLALMCVGSAYSEELSFNGVHLTSKEGKVLIDTVFLENPGFIRASLEKDNKGTFVLVVQRILDVGVKNNVPLIRSGTPDMGLNPAIKLSELSIIILPDWKLNSDAFKAFSAIVP